jgi:hypothetical protein
MCSASARRHCCSVCASAALPGAGEGAGAGVGAPTGGATGVGAAGGVAGAVAPAGGGARVGAQAARLRTSAASRSRLAVPSKPRIDGDSEQAAEHDARVIMHAPTSGHQSGGGGKARDAPKPPTRLDRPPPIAPARSVDRNQCRQGRRQHAVQRRAHARIFDASCAPQWRQHPTPALTRVRPCGAPAASRRRVARRLARERRGMSAGSAGASARLDRRQRDDAAPEADVGGEAASEKVHGAARSRPLRPCRSPPRFGTAPLPAASLRPPATTP